MITVAFRVGWTLAITKSLAPNCSHEGRVSNPSGQRKIAIDDER
jgi:hypothetical protein